MYVTAKEPTSIRPLDPTKNPCPENFKFSGCGICLPEKFRRFRNINFALPIEYPRMALSCGCFDCPPKTFFSGFSICIKKELFKFKVDKNRMDCLTHEEIKPQQQTPPEGSKGIPKYLLVAGAGTLGFFVFIFFNKQRVGSNKKG